jgi:putative transposase
MAYNWRHMTNEQRTAVLLSRQESGRPWHGPPHGLERHWYHISAACYEHRPILGKTAERMAGFEDKLLGTVAEECEKVCVWCVLPNHYHVLVQCRSLASCRTALGKLHGTTSHLWNVQDDAKGRKCWHRCQPREVKNESHRWAVVNYIHHNPIHHKYVDNWLDWPFSSAKQYLREFGRKEAIRIWREYPVFEMGKNWDSPDI